MAKTKPEEEKDVIKPDAAGSNDENQNKPTDPNTTSDSVIVDPVNADTLGGTKADTEQQTTQTFEEARLVDWPQEREGIHTIHTKEGIFSFNNGKASFKSEVALKLREAGYIE